MHQCCIDVSLHQSSDMHCQNEKNSDAHAQNYDSAKWVIL